MRFDSEFIDEIKYRNDIHDVISAYVILKRAGSNYSGLCPFHSEKTPSFTVFPASSSFYCFGCGAGGDVITFLMKSENLDYPSAVEQLAARAGIAMPVQSDHDKTIQEQRSRIYQMNREAAKFFHSCLLQPIGSPGMEYLTQRGITNLGIQHFGLGFAPNEFGYLTDHLQKLGFTQQEMITGFLAGKSQKTGKLYDYFRGRVIYPIIDNAGNVIAFGGRVLDDSKPKYLNTSDTPAFKKSRNLFALNFARHYCQDAIIVCEGYMDVIAMHMAGFQNAVATLGTAITQDHARIIAKYAKKVILTYDNDEAGHKATQKAIRLLEEVGVEIKVLRMSGAKDPDEYIKKFGANQFRRLLDDSVGRLDFGMQNILDQYDLHITSDKIKAADELTTMLSQIRSSVEREIYMSKIADRLDIPKVSLMGDVKRKQRRLQKEAHTGELKANIQMAQGIGDRVNPDGIKNRRAAKAEEQIIGMLLLYPEWIKMVSDLYKDGRYQLKPEEFFSSFHKTLYELITTYYHENGRFDISYLGDSLTGDEMGRAMSLMVKRQELHNDEGVLSESIATLRDANQHYRLSQKTQVELDDLEVLLKRKRNPNEQENQGKDE